MTVLLEMKCRNCSTIRAWAALLIIGHCQLFLPCRKTGHRSSFLPVRTELDISILTLTRRALKADRTSRPSGPDAYPSQSMLTPGGQYVPRSSSLSSHSSTPQTVPPVRSKTDAEERQARQKAARLAGRPLSGLDGYDIGATPQSSMTLDLPALPAGRRKKFSPSRLSTADYAKCREPWALSGIAGWIREMAGGETGEGESDLRQKTIEDGLVALFTHKVPL